MNITQVIFFPDMFDHGSIHRCTIVKIQFEVKSRNSHSGKTKYIHYTSLNIFGNTI